MKMVRAKDEEVDVVVWVCVVDVVDDREVIVMDIEDRRNSMGKHHKDSTQSSRAPVVDEEAVVVVVAEVDVVVRRRASKCRSIFVSRMTCAA